MCVTQPVRVTIVLIIDCQKRKTNAESIISCDCVSIKPWLGYGNNDHNITMVSLY